MYVCVRKFAATWFANYRTEPKLSGEARGRYRVCGSSRNISILCLARGNLMAVSGREGSLNFRLMEELMARESGRNGLAGIFLYNCVIGGISLCC